MEKTSHESGHEYLDIHHGKKNTVENGLCMCIGKFKKKHCVAPWPPIQLRGHCVTLWISLPKTVKNKTYA